MFNSICSNESSKALELWARQGNNFAQQNSTLKRGSSEKTSTYSFIHLFMPPALSEHLFHPSHRAWCREREVAARPGGGGRHLNRWLQHPGRFNNTHEPGVVRGKHRREEDFLWRLKLFWSKEAERENEKCLPPIPHPVQKGASAVSKMFYFWLWVGAV